MVESAAHLDALVDGARRDDAVVVLAPVATEDLARVRLEHERRRRLPRVPQHGGAVAGGRQEDVGVLRVPAAVQGSAWTRVPRAQTSCACRRHALSACWTQSEWRPAQGGWGGWDGWGGGGLGGGGSHHLTAYTQYVCRSNDRTQVASEAFQSLTVSSQEEERKSCVWLTFQSSETASFACTDMWRSGRAFWPWLTSQSLMLPSPEQLATMFSFASLHAMSSVAARSGAACSPQHASRRRSSSLEQLYPDRRSGDGGTACKVGQSLPGPIAGVITMPQYAQQPCKMYSVPF